MLRISVPVRDRVRDKFRLRQTASTASLIFIIPAAGTVYRTCTANYMQYATHGKYLIQQIATDCIEIGF